MHPAIAVRELTKTYAEGASGVPALRGIELDVHSGELVMLVGPSGSGKTTLLSIMGCILSPSAGSVRIAGKEVGATEAERAGSDPLVAYWLRVSRIQSVPDFDRGRERGTHA